MEAEREQRIIGTQAYDDTLRGDSYAVTAKFVVPIYTDDGGVASPYLLATQ